MSKSSSTSKQSLYSSKAFSTSRERRKENKRYNNDARASHQQEQLSTMMVKLNDLSMKQKKIERLMPAQGQEQEGRRGPNSRSLQDQMDQAAGATGNAAGGSSSMLATDHNQEDIELLQKNQLVILQEIEKMKSKTLKMSNNTKHIALNSMSLK